MYASLMGTRSLGEEIRLRTFSDDLGSLTVVEPEIDIDFEIKRVYYLHSLSPEALRGGHAHRQLTQLMVPISGSFTLILEMHHESKTIEAADPRVGYLIPPMTWRDIRNFSPGAVCMVLASARFDEKDYIREKQEYLASFA